MFSLTTNYSQSGPDLETGMTAALRTLLPPNDTPFTHFVKWTQPPTFHPYQLQSRRNAILSRFRTQIARMLNHSTVRSIVE